MVFFSVARFSSQIAVSNFCRQIVRNFKRYSKTGMEVSQPDVEPTRKIVCGDAIEWLKGIPDNGLPPNYSGFTSMPDISELHEMFVGDTASYKAWFTDTAELFLNKLSPGSYCIFLQSDVRVMNVSGDVSEWIDKSFLCSTAAARANCTLMWHKLVTSHAFVMCCDVTFFYFSF
jgi:hypothetical protein